SAPSPRGSWRRRCSPGFPRRRRRRSDSRCRTRSGWGRRRSMQRSSSTSSRTATSTARPSASTAPSAWPPSDRSRYEVAVNGLRGRRNMSTLAGRTILMSGGSRGIGLAIALRAAADGANIVLLAKTDTPHPKLEGTIHTAAEQIEAAGGRALPIVGDVRNDDDVTEAVLKAQGEFGGIDIVINNASVIDLSRSLDLGAKKYDLMQDVNVRGTFMLSRAAIPQLREAANPHILSLSPPLNPTPKWLGAHTGYSL